MLVIAVASPVTSTVQEVVLVQVRTTAFSAKPSEMVHIALPAVHWENTIEAEFVNPVMRHVSMDVLDLQTP